MSELEVLVDSKPAEDGSKRIVKAFSTIEKAANNLAKNTSAKFKQLRSDIDSLSRLRGPGVDVSRRLLDLGNALSGFKSPSSSSISNTKAFFAALNSAGRVPQNVVNTINAVKNGFANFKGPSPQSVQNTKDLLKALSNVSMPRNLSGVVNALQQIGSAAMAAVS